MCKKVGIVILNYNSGNYLKLTLQSLLEAKSNVDFVVGVIDNGSQERERKECKRYISELQEKYAAVELLFFDAEKNLGFSGGNNVVIREFMAREDITHICLLNSDVIVTDYWLDYLLEKDKDVIGPVTNAAGNEQTVEIDYIIEDMDDVDKVFRVVNDFADKRHICYRNYVVESDLVTFFATVFKKEVIQEIGLLDEQFYPGSYEDDDYCIRILKAGFHISIARDCFLHHFGSGSFAKLKMSERKDIASVNRERLEKKWNFQWKDRTWKLLESCKQDMDFLLEREDQIWAKKQIDLSLKQLEQLMKDWGEAILFFTSQADKSDTAIGSYNVKQLIGLIRVRVKRKIQLEWHQLKAKMGHVIHRRKIRKEELTEIERIYQLIDKAKKLGHESLCVFAPMYNKENVKDGYVQRIKAIDTTVLSNMCRIYLYDEGVDCMKMRFDFIDDLHGYIVFNSHNEEHLREIVNLVSKCKRTYTHSLLRFMEDRSNKELWKIFSLDGVKHFWDMHGTVPEEYSLAGSELGCELANNIEKVLAEKADVIVVVTEAMGRFIREKYPNLNAQIIVVPIFNNELLTPIKGEKESLSDGNISIVYAGGTQPWQNIKLMQEIMDETYEKYHFKMFVPDPQEFQNLWEKRKASYNILIDSKAPNDLYKEYETCDFGFVLRDPGPVNYVACPTKIIEYLKFGIIPILKSEEIGDFVNLGMKYISYRDVEEGIDLTEDQRQEMIECNYSVLNMLRQLYLEGTAELKGKVEEG